LESHPLLHGLLFIDKERDAHSAESVAFSPFSKPRRGSKTNNEFRVASRAGDVPLTGAPLHAKVALAAWTGQFHARCLGFECEIALAHAALELSRALVDAGYQNLRARRAGEFLLLPLAPSDSVVNANPSIAKLAGQFS
jgi:hypothetical protein